MIVCAIMKVYMVHTYIQPVSGILGHLATNAILSATAVHVITICINNDPAIIWNQSLMKYIH